MKDEITVKEKEVIQLVVQGLSNKEIAQTLGVEECTVKVHLNHVFSKLGLKSRSQLMAFYYSGMQK